MANNFVLTISWPLGKECECQRYKYNKNFPIADIYILQSCNQIKFSFNCTVINSISAKKIETHIFPNELMY